ncbi:MAG: hypothetical protein M3Y48_20965, partial [Actinomycetota bacterium]|nr:hypothetical protein [Actinomycetota bacterium]
MGVAGGELLDQSPDQAAVLGVEPALQAQSTVAAVPQPQLPPHRGRRTGALTRCRTVGVEGGDQPLRDDPQPAGVEVAGVTDQVRFSAVPRRLRDRPG